MTTVPFDAAILLKDCDKNQNRISSKVDFKVKVSNI